MCGVDQWIHVNCALWSSEVYEEADGRLMNVEVARNRGRGGWEKLSARKCFNSLNGLWSYGLLQSFTLQLSSGSVPEPS